MFIYWFAIHIVVHLAYLVYAIAVVFIRSAAHSGNVALIIVSNLSGGLGLVLALGNYWMASYAPEHAGGDLLTMTYGLAGFGGLIGLGGIVHAACMIGMAIARMSKRSQGAR